jgi:hypothetical protein
VEPVSSVEAFLALYLENPGRDPVAAEILSQLDDDERAVLRSRRITQPSRPPAGAPPQLSEAAAAHVEERALVTLRRALQQRGLLRP